MQETGTHRSKLPYRGTWAIQEEISTGKRATLVEHGNSTGGKDKAGSTIAALSTKELAKSEESGPMKQAMAKGCIETVDDENASNLEMRLGYFGLGLHDRLEVPEADKLLEVVGQIEGRPARILLDTGCST